jgi:hypothetical protein
MKAHRAGLLWLDHKGPFGDYLTGQSRCSIVVIAEMIDEYEDAERGRLLTTRDPRPLVRKILSAQSMFAT